MQIGDWHIKNLTTTECPSVCVVIHVLCVWCLYKRALIGLKKIKCLDQLFWNKNKAAMPFSHGYHSGGTGSMRKYGLTKLLEGHCLWRENTKQHHCLPKVRDIWHSKVESHRGTPQGILWTSTSPNGMPLAEVLGSSTKPSLEFSLTATLRFGPSIVWNLEFYCWIGK